MTAPVRFSDNQYAAGLPGSRPPTNLRISPAMACAL